MKFNDFVPTAYLTVSTVCTLQICIVVENGEPYVYGVFYDNEGNKKSQLTKCRIRENDRGHLYFFKNRQRYYLNDFIKKSHP